MKNKFIFLNFFFILILPISYAYCSLDAHLNLEALDVNGEVSKFQFHEYREDDILTIKDITLISTGNCTIKNPDVKITLKNEKSTVKTPFGIHQNFFDVNLSPYETYTLKSIGNFEYIDSNKKKKRLWGEVLNQEGRWEIQVDITNVGALNQIINGVHLYPVGFRVYTPTDLNLIRLARQSNILSIAAIKMAFAAILVTLLLFIMEHFILKPYRRRKNQENLLKVLLLDLAKIARSSESYKDVFIQNILKHKEFYFKDEDLKSELNNCFGQYLQLLDKNNQKEIENKKGNFELVVEIHDLLKKDKNIVENIEFFCKLINTKINKEKKRFIIDNSEFVLQFFLIRQVDNSFYSKQLDQKIGAFQTLELKSSLINLSTSIEVINFQVNYLNDKYMEFAVDQRGKIRWNHSYYLTFLNLFTLDKNLIYVLKQLLNNELIQKNFDFKREEYNKEYDKFLETKQEIKEELKDIEALNRIFVRSKN